MTSNQLLYKYSESPGGAFACEARSHKVRATPCGIIPLWERACTRIGVGCSTELSRACGAFAGKARSHKVAGLGVLALKQAAVHEQRAVRRQLQAAAVA